MTTRTNAQGEVEVLCCPTTQRPPGPRFPGDRNPVIPGTSSVVARTAWSPTRASHRSLIV